MTVLHDWFQTPPGQYLLDWERAQFDAALADVFGYHALQLGLADIDALAANRMPHRWLALSAAPPAVEPPAADAPAAARWALVTDSTALPFADASLDLVVLPHTLELSADPHATLREVQRVLVHEGKVAIAGLNPLSLWGLRQWRSHLYRGLGGGQPFLPEAGEFIGPLAAARLAAAAAIRAGIGQLRLLAPGGAQQPPAGALCLDGPAGRALVADLRRRLRDAGGQAHTRRMRLMAPAGRRRR
jgi:SAM-dependent methyltransferase